MQSWPNTVCKMWKDTKSGNKCITPLPQHWTVHGIWPNGGTDKCTGPAFNLSLLNPLIKDLREFWPNIHQEKQEDWFWKHEWDDHGICAIELQQFNTQVKYFQQGLVWLDTYTMNKLFPNMNKSEYRVADIHNAIIKALKFSANIRCYLIRDKAGKVVTQYLHEIHICFTRELKLKDCTKNLDNTHDNGLVTNCYGPVPVQFPHSA